jgi:hypothetical protein
MQSTALSPEEYMAALPDDRKEIIQAIREVILKNLPSGFSEQMSYGMLGYVVPHGLYPAGYHCDPKLPLPFLSLASQKNFIALYHMGLYADERLLHWFTSRWPDFSKKKLDMGKSCIRFKKPEDVPLALIGELVSKMTPQDWIGVYESNVKNN